MLQVSNTWEGLFGKVALSVSKFARHNFQNIFSALPALLYTCVWQLVWGSIRYNCRVLFGPCDSMASITSYGTALLYPAGLTSKILAGSTTRTALLSLIQGPTSSVSTSITSICLLSCRILWGGRTCAMDGYMWLNYHNLRGSWLPHLPWSRYSGTLGIVGSGGSTRVLNRGPQKKARKNAPRTHAVVWSHQ